MYNLQMENQDRRSFQFDSIHLLLCFGILLTFAHLAVVVRSAPSLYALEMPFILFLCFCGNRRLINELKINGVAFSSDMRQYYEAKAKIWISPRLRFVQNSSHSLTFYCNFSIIIIVRIPYFNNSNFRAWLHIIYNHFESYDDFSLTQYLFFFSFFECGQLKIPNSFNKSSCEMFSSREGEREKSECI